MRKPSRGRLLPDLFRAQPISTSFQLRRNLVSLTRVPRQHTESGWKSPFYKIGARTLQVERRKGASASEQEIGIWLCTEDSNHLRMPGVFRPTHRGAVVFAVAKARVCSRLKQ